MKVAILQFADTEDIFALEVNDDVTVKQIRETAKQIVSEWEEEGFWDWSYLDLVEELEEKIGVNKEGGKVLWVDINL